MKLNFPECDLKFKDIEEQRYVFDIIRKKYVVAGPEEIVRQHLVHFLIHHRNFPKNLINVEKKVQLGQLSRRTDLVAFNRTGTPILIGECKAPSIYITQKVFEQIGQYNMALKVHWLLITNGLSHFCCKIDLKNKQFEFVKDIPFYENLSEVE